MNSKPALKALYHDCYLKFKACIERSPKKGLIVEIGSGGGFAKDIIPEMITTDVLAQPGIDQVVDAQHLPFADHSIRTLCLLNAFHHIPNVELFLNELQRCLVPEGRVFMIEPYPGILGTPIYRYFHHESFDTRVEEWKFISNDPMKDANNALAWIVFKRDYNKFKKLYPDLSLLQFKPHTPMTYWLSGGNKKWTLLSKNLYQISKWADQILIHLSPRFGSFADIELIYLVKPRNQQ